MTRFPNPIAKDKCRDIELRTARRRNDRADPVLSWGMSAHFNRMRVARVAHRANRKRNAVDRPGWAQERRRQCALIEKSAWRLAQAWHIRAYRILERLNADQTPSDPMNLFLVCMIVEVCRLELAALDRSKPPARPGTWVQAFHRSYLRFHRQRTVENDFLSWSICFALMKRRTMVIHDKWTAAARHAASRMREQSNGGT